MNRLIFFQLVLFLLSSVFSNLGLAESCKVKLGSKTIESDCDELARTKSNLDLDLCIQKQQCASYNEVCKISSVEYRCLELADSNSAILKACLHLGQCQKFGQFVDGNLSPEEASRVMRFDEKLAKKRALSQIIADPCQTKLEISQKSARLDASLQAIGRELLGPTKQVFARALQKIELEMIPINASATGQPAIIPKDLPDPMGSYQKYMKLMTEGADRTFATKLQENKMKGIKPKVIKIQGLNIPGFEAASTYTVPERVEALNQDEQLALHVYTRPEYQAINRILRQNRSGEIQPYLDMAETAISKLKPYSGTSYRAVSDCNLMVQTHVVGGFVRYKAFTSASAGAFRYGGNCKFVIEGRTGVSVGGYSRYQNEGEVLFKPGTTFKVLSRETNGDQHTFIMREVTTPEINENVPEL